MVATNKTAKTAIIISPQKVNQLNP
jgi:hypothetical protein